MSVFSNISLGVRLRIVAITPRSAAQLLRHLLNGLLENGDKLADLLPGDDERRSHKDVIPVDPVHAPGAGVDDQALLEGLIGDPGVDLALRVEGRLALPISDQLHAAEEPQAPHISHDGNLVQVLHLFQEVFPHLRGAPHQIVLADVVQDRVADGAGQGVLAVGVPVHEGPVALPDGPVDRLGAHDAEKRGVAPGQALGADQHIRADSPVLHGEVPAGPPHAGHDLVRDEQHVVFVADLPDSPEIPVLGDHGPGSGPNHRLGHEGGDRIRALVENGPLQVLGALQAAAFRNETEGAAVAIGRADVRRVLNQGLIVAPAAGVAAQGQGSQGVAVIAAPPGDHLVFHGPAPVHLILSGQLDRGFHCLRAAGQIVDPVQPLRGQVHEAPGQGNRGFGGELGAVREGDLSGLLEHGLPDFLHPVTDGDHNRSPRAVDVPLAALIVDVDPLSVSGGGVVLAGIAVEDVILVGFAFHNAPFAEMRHGVEPGHAIWPRRYQRPQPCICGTFDLRPRTGTFPDGASSS